MPSHKQRTVEADSTPRALGPIGGVSTSDSAQLTEMYPASPIHNGTLTDDERRAFYQDEVLNTTINDGGHTFGTFNMDYAGAPDMSEVDLEKHNLPSPYVPNPASPGPGSQNDGDKPAPPEGFGQTPSEAYGPGAGSQLSPRAGADRISRQTIGDYISGKSSADSDT